MSKKQLVVAEDVRAAAKSGQKVIDLHDKRAIITSEASSLAKELGVTLQWVVSTPTPKAGAVAPVDDATQATVRKVIEAHTKGPVSETVMQEVMRRIEQERAQPASGGVRKITSICSSPRTSDKGMNMSHLDLTSVAPAAGVPCSAGFMGWSKNVFPLDCKSDEINLVLEGELQFHVGQEIISAKVGDVMWVSKGTTGKIGTPSSVRFFYLSYPVSSGAAD